MKKYIILSIIITTTLIAKNFIVQKPIIFLTTPKSSIYEEPISIKNLININNSNKKTQNSLKENDRKKLTSYALKFNKRRGIIPTKLFRNDCSGFVRKIFYNFNIELFKLPRKELKRINGTWVNGSELIWKYCKKHGEVFVRKTPKVGDIVFFDNTHDRNKNGKYDDYFTHVGIVVKIDKDKTVHYIHKANSGIKISKLNVKYQNTYRNGKKVVNDFLRSKGKIRLGSQLVRGYGSIYSNPSKKDKKKTVNKKKASIKKHGYLPPEEPNKKIANKKEKKSNTTTLTPYNNHKASVQLIGYQYRKLIVKNAVSLLGKKIKKEDFIQNIYSNLGFGVIDHEFDDEKFVERKIFWTIKKYGRLFTLITPQYGDLIFFDKISNKKHFLNIGIIETVVNDQIKFIYSSNGVIKRGYMNNKFWKIHKKNNQIINSYFVTDKNSSRKLSSEFFRRFGSLFVK